MSLFKRIEKITERITRLISLISLTGLLVLALATVLDVLLRWLFNSPIVGLADTYSLFIAIAIAACFPLCIYYRGNISIRFLGNILGPKVRNLLDAFGYLVMMFIYIVLGWTLWLYTDQLAADGSTTWILGWPVAPWWRIVTIIFILCIPVALVTVIQYLKKIKDGSKRNQRVIQDVSSIQSDVKGK